MIGLNTSIEGCDEVAARLVIDCWQGVKQLGSKVPEDLTKDGIVPASVVYQ